MSKTLTALEAEHRRLLEENYRLRAKRRAQKARMDELRDTIAAGIAVPDGLTVVRTNRLSELEAWAAVGEHAGVRTPQELIKRLSRPAPPEPAEADASELSAEEQPHAALALDENGQPGADADPLELTPAMLAALAEAEG